MAYLSCKAGRASSLILLWTLFLNLLTKEVAARSNSSQNGSTSISLLVTVPLTNNGQHVMDPGWMHYVYAILAVDHFNDRNPIIVPQLADLDCDVIFSNISVMDTGANSHRALRSLVNQLESSGRPDAIAGSYNELPARELSVFATGMQVPFVAHRGVDFSLVQPDKHPYYSQVNADVIGQVDFQAEYLAHIGRNNFIAILYSSDDSILQRVDLLRAALKSKVGADQVQAFSYVSPANELLAAASPERTIENAMRMVKETGFRTLVLVTAHPERDNSDLFGVAADLEMDQGDYLFLIFGGAESSAINYHKVLRDIQKVENGGWLRGAAFLQELEAWEIKDDNFINSIVVQNSSFLETLMRLNPVPNYFNSDWASYAKEELGLSRNETFPPHDIFRILNTFAQGCTYMYDAVITIGLGACQSMSDQNGTTLNGERHLAGIRNVEFHGASGEVRFGNRKGTPGSRVGSTVYRGVVNLLPNGLNGPLFVNTEYLDPLTGKWVELTPFRYSDGTTSPPMPLRDTPDQNYLTPGIRIAGLSLMGMALLTIFISAAWVVRYRSHQVVIAAQPPFLYVLFFGSTIISFVILAMSFDESYGWDEEMLSRACVSIPWLACVGDMICYSALFTKLWRVNKVLQFKRRAVKVSQVAWPALFVLVTAVTLLCIWTSTKDYRWQRYEIDSVTGESIGRCKGDITIYFMIPILLLTFIPTFLTCLMAWKTSDVDDLYSESKWIFTLVVVQVQVIVVGLPVIAILYDVSPDGRFMGQSLLVWTMPMTTMSLIIGPKMFAVRKTQRNNGMDRSASKRGSRQSDTKVSGLSVPKPTTSARLSQMSGKSGKPASDDGAHPDVVAQTVTLH